MIKKRWFKSLMTIIIRNLLDVQKSGLKTNNMENKLEVNKFNKEFVEEARKVGFTDEQIKFLSEWFAYNSDLDNYIEK